MDTRLYFTRVNIELDSVGSAECIVFLDGEPVTFDRTISGPTSYSVDQELSAGSHTLEIKHHRKLPTDATTAVIIKSIAFNDITSDKFVWAGVYTPNYPEPWASKQTDLAKEITNTNCLGWNGVWRLEFTAPVFTWIHRVENLGWIYD
jgi:hypothetical protein